MIEILFFANLKEEIGIEKVSIDKSEISVLQLRKLLEETYKVSLEGTMAAVNEEYAEDEMIVNSNDIVAFIPPVSGG